MILGICANPSQGKTLMQTFLGLWLQETVGAKICANYHLRYPFELIRTYDEFTAMENCSFLGDELWSWLDARNSGDKQSKLINDVLLASGKKGVDIIYSAQNLMQVDPRLRRVTDTFAFPLLDKRTAVCEIHLTDFFGEPLSDTGLPRAFNAKAVYPLYDTHEKVPPIQGLDYLKAQKAVRQRKAEEKAAEMGIDLSKIV